MPEPYDTSLPPYQKHSETSKLGAEHIKRRAGFLREDVYAFIKSKGSYGVTDSELHVAFGIEKTTICPRRRELVLEGRVKDSGYRRKGYSGILNVVWVVCDLPNFVPGKHTKISLKEVLSELEKIKRQRDAMIAECKEQLQYWEQLLPYSDTIVHILKQVLAARDFKAG